ncbi:MAG: DUF4261 domain-containing protein [Lachnospiraceae bacterium]|jgi:hypothetical protein|nr:DUF4261 domain-containing protein [Lachnospiraceae bacterium]
MDTEQRDAAQIEMIRWLSGPLELGREPAQIECVGTFELQALCYYIFRYKKHVNSKWTLGVCGGYENGAVEHCGHIFSEPEEYGDEDIAKRASHLVKRVHQYWEEQAHIEEEHKKKPGNFENIVLLEQAIYDLGGLKKELKEKWKLEDKLGAVKPGETERKKKPEDGRVFVLNWHSAVVEVVMVPSPVAGDEVDYGARKNHTWRNAPFSVKRHKAHLSVTVTHGKISAVESGMLLVKTVAACCSLPGVLGVYANGTVYQTEQYMHFAGMARAGVFPTKNLIWFGHYTGKKGLCGYTFGLSQFGYDEIEVINSTVSETELDDFLLALANQVIYHNVILKHGEVIGFEAWQKLPVTRSRGVAVPGESIKVAFPGIKNMPKTGSSRFVGEI